MPKMKCLINRNAWKGSVWNSLNVVDLYFSYKHVQYILSSAHTVFFFDGRPQTIDYVEKANTIYSALGHNVLKRTKSGLLRAIRNYALNMNKRYMDLGTLLDSCGWHGICNFLQTGIKTHCWRLNQLKSGSQSTSQYLTIHVSILDHFQQLNFDLLGSFNVKSNGGIGLTGYTWFSIGV